MGDDGYELETVYEARVRSSTIYFVFSLRDGVKRVSVMDIKRHTDWSNYHINTATEVNYYVPNGTWILRLHVGCAPDWIFKSEVDGALSSAIISKAWGIKGRHYDAIIEDDIYEGKPTTATEVKKAIEWYEKCIKKEVKDKMLFKKNIYHIMLFNKKTEQIDFKQYIPAKDTQAAVMIAAQTYKDYDPEIHMTLVKLIDYSDYNPIKD